MTAFNFLSSDFNRLISNREDSQRFFNSILNYFEPLPLVGIEFSLSDFKYMDFSTPLIINYPTKSHEFKSSNNLIPKIISENIKCKGLIELINASIHDIIWIEFDESRYYQFCLDPGVFVNLSNTALDLEKAVNSVETLKQKTLSPNLIENFKKVLTAYNTRGDIGVFLGRGVFPFRYSCNMTVSEMFKFCMDLSIIIPCQITKILSEIQHLVDSMVALDIDISEDHITFQGLEVNANGSDNYEIGPELYKILLTKLAQSGWCDLNNAQKIFNWCFCPKEIIEDGYIIKNLTYLMGENNMIPHFTMRDISHLKIQYINNFKRVKAYLSEVYCWKKE